MSMLTGIAMLGGKLTKKFGPALLASLGIGLFTAGVSLTLVNQFVQRAVSSFPAMGQTAIGLMGLAGLDIALSIVIGAHVLAFTVKAQSLVLSKIGKK